MVQAWLNFKLTVSVCGGCGGLPQNFLKYLCPKDITELFNFKASIPTQEKSLEIVILHYSIVLGLPRWCYW